MRFAVIVFCILMLVAPAKVDAQVQFQFKSNKVIIDGMNYILPAPTSIKDGVGMVPLRMLLGQSGHSMRVGNSKQVNDIVDLSGIFGEDVVGQAFEYFDKPCFIFNSKNVLVAIIGIDSKEMMIDGKPTVLPTKTYIDEGVFFVPAKDMCRLLGLELSQKNETFTITKKPEPKPTEKWTDRLLKVISLENIIYICFGIVILFVALFFLLTPLRRIRTNRG
jgi:hypothetical protein